MLCAPALVTVGIWCDRSTFGGCEVSPIWGPEKSHYHIGGQILLSKLRFAYFPICNDVRLAYLKDDHLHIAFLKICSLNINHQSINPNDKP